MGNGAAGLLRLVVVLVAYLLACLAAGTAAVAIAGPGAFGEPHETWRDIYGQSIPLMALVIFGIMFGPAMVMIFIARHSGWRSWQAFTLIAAALGLFFYASMFGGPVLADNLSSSRPIFGEVFNLRLLSACMVAGAVGGLVYWLVAVRLVPPKPIAPAL